MKPPLKHNLAALLMTPVVMSIVLGLVVHHWAHELAEKIREVAK